MTTIAGRALLGLFALSAPCLAQAQPWLDPHLPPERRAELVLAQLTEAEKLQLVHGDFAVPFNGHPKPEGAIGGAGYIPGIPRLGIPALQETDAGAGVANPGNVRPGDTAVGLPSGLCTAATWNEELAQRCGQMIGREASQKGFNVMLAGGVNLLREPRNGRNFEYGGEDPLLAGTLVGDFVRGIQSNHVMSTIKHFALNDQETGRMVVSSEISPDAARESDLLAFELALERGRAGSVMCSYNRINGVYASQNDELLNHVLKGDWRYPGFVMSDWGSVHSSAEAANGGLDQESGVQLDSQTFFDQPLKAALERGQVSHKRLDEMVVRILRSMFATGLVDHPPVKQPLDVDADEPVAREDARQGMVLLKNAYGLLPLESGAGSVLLIGSHADVGVLSGGGSSQVIPVGGIAVPGLGPSDFPGPEVYDPSSPLKAFGNASYDDGSDLKRVAERARQARVCVVFAHQWLAESFDAPGLSLPDGQDQLIEAVAAANPRTVVVLETGGPVTMPWLGRTAAVIEAWYPGARGGEAIADLVFGRANPSGRLPVTFPESVSQLPRPTMLDPRAPGVVSNPSPTADIRSTPTVSYDVEGADVGYRWYQRRNLKPLFPFGFGLSYTTFSHSDLTARWRDGTVSVRYTVTNTGKRAGWDTPQLYVQLPDGSPRRLAGWSHNALASGQGQSVSFAVDRRLLCRFREGEWRLEAGTYTFSLRSCATDESGPTVAVRLQPAVFPP